jgi:S1-C subfamily serine protease
MPKLETTLVSAFALIGFAIIVGFMYIASAAPAPYTIQDTTVLLSLSAGHGSGTVIDAKRGLVLTAGHVAIHAKENDGKLNLETADGCKETAHVVWIGEHDDVALMQADGTCKLHAAHLRSSPLVAGEKVFAIGYPLWMPRLTTEGQVLAPSVHREDSADTVVIHSALLAPGNSGGGLFDVYGNLVGVNIEMAIFENGGVEYPSGHYMAVPAVVVCNYVVCN